MIYKIKCGAGNLIVECQMITKSMNFNMIFIHMAVIFFIFGNTIEYDTIGCDLIASNRYVTNVIPNQG